MKPRDQHRVVPVQVPGRLFTISAALGRDVALDGAMTQAKQLSRHNARAVLRTVVHNREVIDLEVGSARDDSGANDKGIVSRV
jgi:hypothetical protein